MRTTHAARVSTLLAIVGVLAPMPRGSLAQPGGGSGGGSGGGGPPETDDDGTSVLCEEDGTSAHYEEFFEGEESTMVRWGGSDTGCPNHVNWDLNPNDAKENPSNMSIPAYPMMFEDEGTTDLSSTPNAVGIMRNGVTMFSSWALNTVVEYEDTAFYLEADTLDLCGGHSTIEGTYHYHSVAGCLQEQAMVNDGTSADGHSAILGWAYDGFPIYGQLGPNGVEMKMCDLDGADAEACLDVCSGYEALLPTVDDFTYRYYTSCGFDESFFPFTTNCFRGCCPDGVTCSEKVEACGDNPEVGYTDDYEPFLTENLTVQYDADLVEGDDTDFIDSEYTVNCSLYMGAGSTLSVTGTTPSPAGGTVVGGTPSPASDGSTPEPTASGRGPPGSETTSSPSTIRNPGGPDQPTLSPIPPTGTAPPPEATSMPTSTTTPATSIPPSTTTTSAPTVTVEPTSLQPSTSMEDASSDATPEPSSATGTAPDEEDEISAAAHSVPALALAAGSWAVAATAALFIL